MKTLQITLLLLLITVSSYANTDVVTSTTVVRDGVTFGSVIAIVASWSRNESILWAILHGIFSWLYVIYFALTRK